MKQSYLGALLTFVLVTGAIALLSTPRESTWVAMYLDGNKLKRAEKLLWKQYQRDPDDLAAATKLIDILEALKKKQCARELLQEILQRHHDNNQLKRRLALVLLAENAPHAAARVLAPHERDKKFWLGLAQGYHDIFEEYLAEEALWAGYEGDADKAEAWRTLALWRAERNDTQGEKEALEQALHSLPGDKDLITRYFRNRVKAEDLQRAIWAADKLPKPLERDSLEALYKLYSTNRDYPAAQAILEQIIARKDATVADSLALVSILYLQNALSEAQALLEKLAAQAQDFPASTREALLSQTRTVRFALLLEAAQHGNEQAIFKEITALRGLSSPLEPEVLRNLLYACLQLSDFYSTTSENKTGKTASPDNQKKAKERSLFWLEQAKRLFDENREFLSIAERANAYLLADLAERSGDWRSMLDAWKTIARGNELNVRPFLGIARASQHLHEYESAWQSLRKAEVFVKNDKELLELALLSQAVARAMPKRSPQHAEKQRHADTLARKYLATGWNDTLARNLFFRALEIKNLREAEDLLQTLEDRGLATPRDYLGLTEVQVAMELRRSKPEKGAKGSFKVVPPGPGRDRAVRNALKVLEANAPETLTRLLYVFTALNDKQQVLTVLNLIERAHLPETPAMLRQLSDAYGFLGDAKRQFALLEKRAQLSGQVTDWIDAIDRRYWSGDYQSALRLLTRIEPFYPGNADLVGRRILALVEMRRYGQAIKVFQNVQRQESEISKKLSAESVAALAFAYDRNGFSERARRFFKLSLTKDPENSHAVLGLADLLKREGKTATAARLVQNYLERNPENIWARVELANLRPAQEKRQYEHILANVSSDASAGEKSAQALALWRTGQLKKALKIYSNLMQDPNRTPAMLCDYAQALMDADKLEEAKHILHVAMREYPDHLLTRRLLATIFIREKNYASAETWLRKALEMEPHCSELSREIAFVQQVQKKFWSAQKNWLAAGKH